MSNANGAEIVAVDYIFVWCVHLIMMMRRWHPSRILKIDANAQKAFVHFAGWSVK